MKITDINAVAVRVPLERTFPASTYEIRERCTIITEVITDAGIVGRTFLGDNRDQQAAVMAVLVNQLGPMLIGEDPLLTEKCWHKMFSLTLSQGNRREIAEAIAAIDTALWDVRGKASGLPVYKLIGGYTNRLQPIVTGGYYTTSEGYGELIEEIQQIRENGFAGVKIKVGGLSPTADAKRIEAVRTAVGEDFIIAVDANQGWNRDEAVSFGRAVRDLELAWFEEPIQWYDEIKGMKQVRVQTGIKVCAGQSEFSNRGCRELVEGEAVDILNFDVSVGAGITEWLRVARLAETFNISMTHHEEPYICMHLLGSIKHGLYPEYFSNVRDPLTPVIIENPPEIKNGWVTIPEKPGFGLSFDEAFIQKYRI